jgi:HSP20 family molecular chaperone IbpA
VQLFLLFGAIAGLMTMADPSTWMWTEACALIERAERLHRQFFEPSLSSTPHASWQPPVDIFETPQELLIIAALPGVDPQDLEITLERQLLRIAGLRRLSISRGTTIHRLEIPYGRFERRIGLPPARLQLNGSELQNGCLFVSLTKRL